jgi:hypothetical protein
MELFDMGQPMKVELMEVWRDKALADELRSEIRRQAVAGWKPWEILLPPALLWPMLEEVSSGMTMTWTPVLFDIGVQVSKEDEVAIRFILPDLKTSPVMVKVMPYRNLKATVPVEVGHGNQV